MTVVDARPRVRSAEFVAEARAALVRAREYRARGGDWREVMVLALDTAAANRSAAWWFRSHGR